MLELRRLDQADRDLDEIWLRIALENPPAAERVVRNIESAERRLAEFPRLGRVRSELTVGLRSWPVGNYLIFYLILAESIEVIRILHGARDLETELSS